MDYSKIPVAPPPPGVSSNFIDPYSRGDLFMHVGATFLALMLSCIFLRMWTKVVVMKSTGGDDLSGLVAAIGQCAYFAILVDLTQHGIGRHMWDVPVSMFIPRVAKEFQVISIITMPTVFFAKLSLLLLYHRLFNVATDIRYGVYFGIGINLIISIVISFGYIFMPKMRDKMNMAYTIGVVNVVSDLYLIILPTFAVSRLQLSLKKKVGVMAIFMTGSLQVACIASVLGLVYRIELRKGEDTTWKLIPVYIACSVELNVGIICSCLPIMPALYRAYKPRCVLFYSSMRSIVRGSTTKSSIAGSKIAQDANMGNRYDNPFTLDKMNESRRQMV